MKASELVLAVEAGANAEVTPVGRVELESATLPVNPPTSETEIVLVPVAP